MALRPVLVWRWVTGVVLAAHAILAMHAATVHSATFDEVVYPTSGYAYLTTGDYRMNPEHPPLLKLWAALPWLSASIDVRGVDGWFERDQWTFARELMYDPTTGMAVRLAAARWMIAALSVAGGLGIALVARRLAGEAAGALAAAAWSFDPLVLAHAGLATTDLGAAVLYFGAAVTLPGALLGRRSRWLVAAGLLAGFAWAAKFSTLPLVVLGAGIATAGGALERIRVPSGQPPPAKARWARFGLWLLVGMAVVLATYGPNGPVALFEGLARLVHHEQVGHPSYAFGVWADEGLWWYFPAAWAVKTPIPLLALTMIGLGVLAVRFRRHAVLSAAVLIAPALVGGAALVSSLNLGIRHLLPLTPFLAVAAGVAGRVAAERFRREGSVVVALAFGWLVVGTIAAHPHYLAYGNAWVGGSSGVGRVLADSNVDWGQDLPALASILNESPVRRVYLSYFGTAEPAAHGIRYHSLPGFGMATRRFEDGPDADGRTWLAISVTHRLDVYTRTHDVYAWLRDREPDRRAGGSILLYDLTGDALGLRQVGLSAMQFGDAEAALGPLMDAATVDRGDARTSVALARVFASLGRWDEAVAQCDAAVVTSDGDRGWCDRIRSEAAARQ